jgi:hypothetical protein
MSDESAWTMFAVYREDREPRRYRVAYFTEMDERTREAAIGQVMAGELVYGGFLADARKELAKRRLEELVAALNHGEAIQDQDIARAVAEVDGSDVAHGALRRAAEDE